MTRTTHPAAGPVHMIRVSFLAGLLEQDGARSWHVLATNDGRWFHSVECFPETEKQAALRYLSLVQGKDETEGDREDRTIFHHPV